ncbi:diacylglycerol kinase family protein [Sphingomicrobium sp. XHP0235]|uniref:diacylglycerol/lipid kinase family protein n=1 Tax=Sphingomicrobium aquimarinum TaxID=3133971 RepID=UPI0031FE752E
MHPWCNKIVEPSTALLAAVAGQMNAQTDLSPTAFWLVYNQASHSTDEALVAAFRERIASVGARIVGETDFPREPIPEIDELEAADAEVLIAYGGDGTITCAASALSEWGGAILALPGGTMNLVPKKLHGDTDALAVLDRVLARPKRTALPYVSVGEHRSYARIIAGPAAHLVSVREGVRDGDFRRAWRALRLVWKLMFAADVRIDTDDAKLSAVMVHAESGDLLAVDPVRKGGVFHALRLAWSWLGGLLLEDGALRREELPRVRVEGRGRMHIVIDGEEMRLEGPLDLVPNAGASCFLVADDDA